MTDQSNSNMFIKMMLLKSDSELQEYIDNKEMFQESAVLAAVEELEKRGLSSKEVCLAKEHIELTKQKEEEVKIESKRKMNYTDDPDAPLLFPKWSMWVFSVLLTPAYASVLMAFNFHQLKQQNSLFTVLGFAAIFTSLTGFLYGYLQTSSGKLYVDYILIINGIGGLIIELYFWNKLVGKETKYRPRPIILAFVISVIIAVGLFYLQYVNN